MMGVGKTTLGKIVSKMTDLKFIDTDANIEKNCLMKISEIFKRKGEKFCGNNIYSCRNTYTSRSCNANWLSYTFINFI